MNRFGAFLAVVVVASSLATTADAQIWIPIPPGGYRYAAADSAIRFDVKPNDAEVYIDGYYAGIVDDYDGVFQRLHVIPGPHDVTVYRDGYRSFTQKMYLSPNSTVKIKRMLEHLGAGETAEPRPAPAPLPTGTQPSPPLPRGPGRRPPTSPPGNQPPSTDAERGTLTLRVQPADAEVLVDGEPWRGSAADEITIGLAEGTHNLQVRKAGYVGYLTDVRIRRGEDTKLNVSLRPQP
jgi:hypothetical protein